MSTEIQAIHTPPAGASQGTIIEQSRAVAEVAAAVRVAQDYPRDITRAFEEMRQSCGLYSLARKAFYEVPNRGAGPTVHLARELARIFGNIDYGVRELRRDDAEGVSEIQAFAWDQQTNVRSTRTFIVPHVRMKGGRRQPLTDVQDIYLTNQNIGARAVRECLFTVLPVGYVDEAQDLCRTTLERGEGGTLEDRIEAMVNAYGKANITEAQLAARIGRPRAKWTPQDLADMGILFESLRRREISREEAFPDKPATAAEIAGPSTGELAPDDPAVNSHWDEAKA